MKTQLFIISMFSSAGVFGQVSALLDTNDISANIKSDGTLFFDGTSYGIFEVPKGSGVNSIFAGNTWIGGIDAGGQLHVAAQTYGQNNNVDYFYGPIASNYSAASYTSTYNNVWKINKSTINYHIANYTTGGYVVPASIANWPGNGNVSNGEAAVLAPYVDVNSNNTYDPANGDYPKIRGDQAIFFMVNDAKQAHGSGGMALGIEVHGMAYSFASAIDSALKQTVFLNYEIFNRSTFSYDSVYVGAWTDMDLGDYSDDYVGCDSLLNMFYTYNGDNMDGSGGLGTYGTPPPAQGTVFLNYPISKSVYHTNNAPNGMGDPTTASEYYNYLSGSWKDGTPFTYGGTGYGGTTPANFMFSGDPVAGTGWTEAGAGNVPGDRRGMMSVGPFELPAGAKICVDIAYPWARDYAGNNLTSITLLRQRVQSIQTFYNNQGYLCQFLSGVNENNSQENFISVYPNPTNGSFQVATGEKFELKIYNVLGEEILISHKLDADSKIDISNQPNGIYFLEIIQDGNVSRGKLVKN